MFAPFSCDVDGINNERQIVLRKRNYVVALKGLKKAKNKQFKQKIGCCKEKKGINLFKKKTFNNRLLKLIHDLSCQPIKRTYIRSFHAFPRKSRDINN